MNMFLLYNMLCLEGVLFNLKNKLQEIGNIQNFFILFIYFVKILMFFDNRLEIEYYSNKIDRFFILGLFLYYIS